MYQITENFYYQKQVDRQKRVHHLFFNKDNLEKHCLAFMTKKNGEILDFENWRTLDYREILGVLRSRELHFTKEGHLDCPLKKSLIPFHRYEKIDGKHYF